MALASIFLSSFHSTPTSAKQQPFEEIVGILTSKGGLTVNNCAATFVFVEVSRGPKWPVFGWPQTVDITGLSYLCLEPCYFLDKSYCHYVSL